jgi:hypothetical protein
VGHSLILSGVGPDEEEDVYRFLTGPGGYAPTFYQFPLDEARIREHIRAALCAVIRDDDGRIIASIGGYWTMPWFSNKMMLELLWLLVLPEYRGHHRQYDDALLAWFKGKRDEIAAEYGHDVPILDTVLAEDRLPGKLRLWRKHGLPIGGVFLIP